MIRALTHYEPEFGPSFHLGATAYGPQRLEVTGPINRWNARLGGPSTLGDATMGISVALLAIGGILAGWWVLGGPAHAKAALRRRNPWRKRRGR